MLGLSSGLLSTADGACMRRRCWISSLTDEDADALESPFLEDDGSRAGWTELLIGLL